MRLASPAEAYRDAKTAALKALGLDDASADAQVALGTVLLFGEWDWIGAERSLRRALQIQPEHQQGLLTLGRLLDARGRHDEALSGKFRALESDPKSPLVHAQLALSYWNRRDYDGALEWARKAIAIDAQQHLAREFLIAAHLRKGDYDVAIAEALRHAESCGVSREVLQPMVDAYAAGGRPGVVRWSLDHSRRAGAPAFQLAVLSAEAGAREDAFAYLNRAIEDRDPSLVDLAVAPQWDPLRGDPRFAACLSRVGLPADLAEQL
jgi:tetratricopeptide (TPR) repeat protein